MNKFKFYFLVLFASFSLFSCEEEEVGIPVEPPRDYMVQYVADTILIKDYLETHYLDMDLANPNFADKDVVIKKRDKEQPSIMSYLNNDTFPKLKFRTVNMHGLKDGYKIYYLVLREGGGEYPTNTDNILTAYKGEYLSKQTVDEVTTIKTTFFEEIKFPQKMTDLSGLDLLSQGGDLIKGWKEIFPQFKSGDFEVELDGTVKHSDFGAGVMFLPSGLAYYNSRLTSIPAYSPLVFSFKLYSVQRLDHDNDGIVDFYEDLDNDRYLPYFRELVRGVAIAGDTDNDGVPNYLDIDDDGDGTTTKLETKRPDLIVDNVAVSNGYYPFDGAKDDNGNPFDDLSTPNIDESQGIPSYEKDDVGDKFDYTTPGRTRVYLNKDYPIKK